MIVGMKSKWRQTLARGVVLVGVFLFGAMPSAGAANAVAAHVVRFSHPPAKYSVLRNNHPLPVTFNMSLINGDVVVVNEPSATLGIRFVDSRDVSISKANSPYRIESRATKPEVTSNFLLTLWSNVTKAQTAGSRSTSTRDTASAQTVWANPDTQPLALRLPGLSDATAQIAAGERHLMLRWEGGKPPFRVQVRAADGKLLCDEAGIPSRVLAIRSHTVALPPGRYGVRISDSADAAVNGGFAAVANAPVAVVAVNAGDDPAASVTDAATRFLEKNDHPSHYYEAYLTLYDALGKGWEPAEALAAWIAEGATTP